MDRKTVAQTVRANLCCGCGICKGICPKSCISWEKINGLYIPRIDQQLCIRCGLCADVCPGIGHIYEESDSAVSAVTGPVISCFNAWSKDPSLRHVSASGGVVSTLIDTLLTSGQYDGAFCVDSYNYEKQLTTRLYSLSEFTTDWNQSKTPKSRYLPVSHENAVAYVKANRNAKIIFIGTSCSLRGFEAALKKMNLKRDQYLLIGLFCDQVLNYNVIPYFKDKFCQGTSLDALHFKNKESGGWPGNMKFFPSTGEPFYESKTERGKAKAYFMPERCLYCVDKLNVQADISLGDNYTGLNSSELGSNSVILRTQRGLNAWQQAQAKLEAVSVDIEAIRKAQSVEWRLNNLYFGDLRTKQLKEDLNLNCNIPREQNPAIFEQKWKQSLRKLNSGQIYDSKPESLARQIKKDEKKTNPVIAFCRRGYYYLKRKLS